MMTVRDIAAKLGAAVEGDAAAVIGRVAKIEEAGPGDISFLANPKYQKYLETTNASAVIIGRKVAAHGRDWLRAPGLPPCGRPVHFVSEGSPAVSTLRKIPCRPGIHPTAVVEKGVKLGADVRLGAHVVVGERAAIGDGAMILHGTVIGRDVTIGARTLLYANVTVREGCRIGERVIIHSGTVIGSDGFGFAPKPDGSYEKIPQLGIVAVGDDVEIGANCTVDRATMGETRIEKGAKLDNLIQVAHNVVIGENTVIAAQAGISGSTKIGKRNMIGGQVGFTGHLAIADDSKWGAQSGVHRSAARSGRDVHGHPGGPVPAGVPHHGSDGADSGCPGRDPRTEIRPGSPARGN